MTSGCFLGWRVCLVIFSDVSFLVRALVGSFQASSSVAVTIGHSISKRRPVDLTAEQAASISFSPHIMRLSRRVETLRGQAKHSGKAMDEYKKAYGELRSEKQSMRRRLKQLLRLRVCVSTNSRRGSRNQSTQPLSRALLIPESSPPSPSQVLQPSLNRIHSPSRSRRRVLVARRHSLNQRAISSP